jgi:hypothetical protein
VIADILQKKSHLENRCGENDFIDSAKGCYTVQKLVVHYCDREETCCPLLYEDREETCHPLL